MTDPQRKLLLQVVSMGEYPAWAARYVGLTPQAVSMRKKRDPEFAEELEKAIAAGRFNLVATVRREATRNGKLALEMLARRWPEEWARPADRVAMAALKQQSNRVGQAAYVDMFAAAVKTLPLPDFADGASPKEGSEPAVGEPEGQADP
jgi:hypothetical protein